MGTTLWVLSKGRMTDGDDWDHSALFNAVEKLDPLCEELGVTKLSLFLDWSDFIANMSDEEFQGDDEINVIASWFTPDTALMTLQILRKHLANHPTLLTELYDESTRHFSDVLIEELDDCIAKLERISSEGDLFHFCVVM